jgi:hypothetical protein
MVTPSTIFLWLSQQAGPLIIIGCLIAFIMIVLYLSARSRRRAMNEQRAGINEYTFVNHLAAYGFDANIARVTYQYLQEKQRVSFPIEATDLLDEDLGLGSGDVAESVQDLLALTERMSQPGMLHMPLVTVEDLVRFLQASPRRTEVAA